jgi:hypothetical protein
MGICYSERERERKCQLQIQFMHRLGIVLVDDDGGALAGSIGLGRKVKRTMKRIGLTFILNCK